MIVFTSNARIQTENIATRLGIGPFQPLEVPINAETGQVPVVRNSTCTITRLTGHYKLAAKSRYDFGQTLEEISCSNPSSKEDLSP